MASRNVNESVHRHHVTELDKYVKMKVDQYNPEAAKIARTVYTHADEILHLSDWDHANAGFMAALRIYKTLPGLKHRAAACAHQLGLIQDVQGKKNQAVVWYAQAITMYKNAADEQGGEYNIAIIKTYTQLAYAYLVEGKLREAAACVDDGLDVMAKNETWIASAIHVPLLMIRCDLLSSCKPPDTEKALATLLEAEQIQTFSHERIDPITAMAFKLRYNKYLLEGNCDASRRIAIDPPSELDQASSRLRVDFYSDLYTTRSCQNRHKESLDAAIKVCEILEKAPTKDGNVFIDLSVAYSNRTAALRALGEYPAAYVSGGIALKHMNSYVEASKSTVDMVNVMRDLAEISMDLREYARAASEYANVADTIDKHAKGMKSVGDWCSACDALAMLMPDPNTAVPNNNLFVIARRGADCASRGFNTVKADRLSVEAAKMLAYEAYFRFYVAKLMPRMGRLQQEEQMLLVSDSLAGAYDAVTRSIASDAHGKLAQSIADRYAAFFGKPIREDKLFKQAK